MANIIINLSIELSAPKLLRIQKKAFLNENFFNTLRVMKLVKSPITNTTDSLIVAQPVLYKLLLVPPPKPTNYPINWEFLLALTSSYKFNYSVIIRFITP